ncbi:arginine--tRNA ligase [Candidatus Nitrosotenuis aquarius]|uniref:arginine--tRNA ligase n=1 Tax=Candidatus Nitrosotenuis aquarius TaxID=1846278 RepID=UPI000C1E7693|nr:arginine--tRNA ligase [Candidatus Nitrosotenuis aquarius]
MSFRVLLDEIRKNLLIILEQQKISDLAFSLEPAKEGFGDVSCNVAFLAAKALKKRPNEIAQEIADKYQQFLGGLVSKAEAHPSGYVNFYADTGRLGKIVIVQSQKDDYSSVNVGSGATITVEHTSVNPNKALHIGHVRNVVVGDSIIRILQKAGYQINTLNYVDDSGLQVADILLGFRHLGFSQEPPAGQKFDHYCGDEVYVKTTEKYQANPELQEKRNQILKEIEYGNSETANFASKITRRVLSEQLKTCWRLGVSYDCLNFESEIVRSRLWPQIFEKLKQMNLVKFESEGKNKGCWVILAEGEEDKVLVRSNGTATYIAKDIPYAAWKLGLVEDPFYYATYCDQPNGKTLYQTTLVPNDLPKHNYSSDKVITVIDSRQARLQNIITTLMAKFGQNKKEYVHLSYESVTLSSDTANSLGLDTGGKSAQMSGRKGLYVNADKILDMLEQKTLEETKKRNPDLSDNTLHKIAKNVAVATLRYEMIKQDLDKIITFDTTKSLSLEGDTAPYIQYAYARASRIIEKSNTKPNFDAKFELLQDQYESALVKAIGKLDLAVQDAANNLSPKVIAKYCYSLAVSFNGFYEHVRVLDAEPDLLNARVCLVYAFQRCLQRALNLIGIDTPERM